LIRRSPAPDLRVCAAVVRLGLPVIPRIVDAVAHSRLSVVEQGREGEVPVAALAQQDLDLVVDAAKGRSARVVQGPVSVDEPEGRRQVPSIWQHVAVAVKYPHALGELVPEAPIVVMIVMPVKL